MQHTYEQFKQAVDQDFLRHTKGNGDYREFMNGADYAEIVKARYEDAKDGDQRQFDSVVASCSYCLWQLA